MFPHSSEALTDGFASELLPNEHLLWEGKPLLRVIFHSADWLLIPFSFMWGGFSIFWEWGAARGAHTPAFFYLWGLMFVLIGQYLIWGRFLYDAWLKTRTAYAVTTERVLVARRGMVMERTSCSLSSLPAVSLEVRTDGVGTIDFSPDSSSNPRLTKNSSRSQSWSALRKFAFVDIPNAQNVRSLLLTQQRKRMVSLANPESQT